MKICIGIGSFLAVSSVSAFVPSSSRVPKRTALANDLFDETEDKGNGGKTEMSQALPFVPRPKLLDGSLAGDVGFE